MISFRYNLKKLLLLRDMPFEENHKKIVINQKYNLLSSMKKKISVSVLHDHLRGRECSLPCHIKEKRQHRANPQGPPLYYYILLMVPFFPLFQEGRSLLLFFYIERLEG